ncbi:unnamed protein product [Somion occarium]|uniref:Secreted protein n=1 Tax=Somion occarium TaxID=3059160 RepID=A0ABP1E4L0_9APHY
MFTVCLYRALCKQYVLALHAANLSDNSLRLALRLAVCLHFFLRIIQDECCSLVIFCFGPHRCASIEIAGCHRRSRISMKPETYWKNRAVVLVGKLRNGRRVAVSQPMSVVFFFFCSGIPRRFSLSERSPCSIDRTILWKKSIQTNEVVFLIAYVGSSALLRHLLYLPSMTIRATRMPFFLSPARLCVEWGEMDRWLLYRARRRNKVLKAAFALTQCRGIVCRKRCTWGLRDK